MVRLLALVLASTALVGATQAPTAPPATAAAPAAKPQYGTFGFDTSGMDRSIAPGDDFFGYANGTWVKNTPIPPDKARYGLFDVLQDLSTERTRGIIEEQAKDPNSRIGAAYESFMDEAAVDAKGLTPFDPWLNQVRAVKSNAIVLAKGQRTVGVSAGQMSRVVSVQIACEKAGDEAKGSVLASDAFFPFPDGVEAAAAKGITAVAQPGGSVKDADVIAACDRLGVAMVMTGFRHFRH